MADPACMACPPGFYDFLLSAFPSGRKGMRKARPPLAEGPGFSCLDASRQGCLCKKNGGSSGKTHHVLLLFDCRPLWCKGYSCRTPDRQILKGSKYEKGFNFLIPVPCIYSTTAVCQKFVEPLNKISKKGNRFVNKPSAPKKCRFRLTWKPCAWTTARQGPQAGL